MTPDDRVPLEKFVLSCCVDYEPIFKACIPTLKGYTWAARETERAYNFLSDLHEQDHIPADMCDNTMFMELCEALNDTADSLLSIPTPLLHKLCDCTIKSLLGAQDKADESALRGARSIAFWCKLSADIRERKGFVTTKENMLEKLMLCVSELAEAGECVRGGMWEDHTSDFGKKPEGFGVELADCCIRIFDICGSLGIDLEAAIAWKTRYNETRPRMHGKVNPGGA